MENTTKTRILEQALVSFARDGYKGTNLRDLAAELGLTKSALYKHYESKEAIWNALIDQMEAYYTGRFGSPEKLPPAPKTWQEFSAMVMGMLNFTMHDPKIILIRRLLLTEQFRDERARHFATLHFLTGTHKMYTEIFTQMMEQGLMKQDDPSMVAFAFTTPITALVHQRDREPEKEREILAQLEAFLRHFMNTYGTEKKEDKSVKTSIILTTERLRIRLSSNEEMQALIDSAEDEGLKLAYTEMLTMAREHPESRPWYGAWFIEDTDGERVGELCFKGLSADGATEIGYGILPEFQGNGYATEAVKAVTQWALSQPGVTCITAETEEDNAASQKVLTKAGFAATGEYGEEGPLFALVQQSL